MQKWEYNKLNLYDIDRPDQWKKLADFDELGANGWELVSILPFAYGGNVVGEGAGGTMHVYAYFKRPIED